MSDSPVGYVGLHRTGELRRRAEQADQQLPACRVCPWHCGVDRVTGPPAGRCRTGRRAVVSSYHPHFGEEAPLVGRHGSGAIFFAWCNLSCRFCQNYEVSQGGDGRPVEPDELAGMMLQLQALGCHNVNLVSPSHVVSQVLAGLTLAVEAGLRIPIVYNSGGYDDLETLRQLDGIVDIYMPDMKFADPDVAERWCGARDYPEVNRAAVREMHRQVGDLTLDQQGVARRGLLVRHLVLPAGLAGTGRIMRFLADEVSPDTYVNVMAQYRPCYQARNLPPLNRPLTRDEFDEALLLADRAGLRRLDSGRGR